VTRPAKSERPLRLEDVPPAEPAPLPAAKLFDTEAPESGEGVFSTVADALRTWTSESVHPAAPPAGPAPSAAPAATNAPSSPGLKGAKPTPSTAYDTMRQTPRHDVTERRLAIQVDGAEALLVDLSKGGAQVVTPAMLKPGRQVKVVLPTKGAGSHGKARVAWSKLEPPSSGSGILQYRAGLTFTSVDHKAIERILEG
jgi:hypothetical protein